MRRWHWWLAGQVLRGRIVRAEFDHMSDRITLGIDTRARSKRELAHMRKEIQRVGR